MSANLGAEGGRWRLTVPWFQVLDLGIGLNLAAIVTSRLTLSPGDIDDSESDPDGLGSWGLTPRLTH